MVSAVVFDLDGTLFDHSSSARRGLRQWLAGLDVVLTNELASTWFEAEERHGTSWREGEVSWAEQRRRRPCGTLLYQLSHPRPVAGVCAASSILIDRSEPRPRRGLPSDS
jgi:putative hydrolase of the HAD superfamily